MHDTIAPFAQPLYVMAKPAGSHCNLACEYCYYLEKSRLYHDTPVEKMSDETLELYIRQYLAARPLGAVEFTWHGGEPLMRPLSFYRKALALQRKYGGGRQIDNVLQTNGTMLTEDWCRFLHDNRWLVGVSIDGPQEYHDAYRRSRMGRPSFRKVTEGIRLLNRFGVEWNAMAVVNDRNAGDPLAFYRFFRDNGCRFIQFTPVVERVRAHADGRRLASLADGGKCRLAPFSVTPEQWGSFLCAVFDEWVRHDVGQVFVQLFDATLANWVGEMPGLCTVSPMCGHAAVMEWNGDVYSCDHFVFPEYKLGNIHDHTLTELLYSDRQRAFARMKVEGLPRQCKSCRWLRLCYGECPKNRFARTADGEPGLNYLCAGYRRFFEHAAPYMDFMADQLRRRQPPAAVMEWARGSAVGAEEL